MTAAPTTTAAPAARPARTCGWTTPPFDLPTGGRMAFLHLTVNGRTEQYRVVWLEQDDFQLFLRVSKELPDGSFDAGYDVSLPGPGVCGRGSCSCPAAKYHGGCKHVSAIAKLCSITLAEGT